MIFYQVTERIFSADGRFLRLRWKSARSLFWLFSVIDGCFFGAQNPLGRFFGYCWLSRLLFRSLFWLFIVEFWVKNNLRKQPKFGYSRFLRLLFRLLAAPGDTFNSLNFNFKFTDSIRWSPKSSSFSLCQYLDGWPPVRGLHIETLSGRSFFRDC